MRRSPRSNFRGEPSGSSMEGKKSFVDGTKWNGVQPSLQLFILKRNASVEGTDTNWLRNRVRLWGCTSPRAGESGQVEPQTTKRKRTPWAPPLRCILSWRFGEPLTASPEMKRFASVPHPSFHQGRWQIDLSAPVLPAPPCQCGRIKSRAGGRIPSASVRVICAALWRVANTCLL